MRQISGKCLVALATITVVVVAGGCRKGQFSLNFSHEQHVVENELECAMCHVVGEDDAMIKPDHAICSECHEIGDEPSQECLVCHKVNRPEEIEVRYQKGVEKEKEEIVFSHERHAGYIETECKDCHSDALSSVSSKDNLLPRKESCLVCHDDQTAPLEECSACHVESSPINATHKLDWEWHHGFESKFASSRCMTCHHQEACIDCHRDEKPRDHNNAWRRITHGAEAAWNRSRCMVCHQEDSCEKCHRSTKPRTHRGGWAAGERSRHCSFCHFPISAVSCGVCHKELEHPKNNKNLGRPPHPIPPGAEDCSLCHLAAGG